MNKEQAVQEKEYGKLLRRELNRIVRELRRLKAKKVILFGSFVRGRADLFTDLDLIVVLESEISFVERTGWLYRQLVPRVAVDILPYTPSEWEEVRKRPFFQKAISEGKVLYAQRAG
ncbi:MAG: nucleotidyltransferase domain-containing protein [Peptococcaceae bacterium]|nr:MAG: nucleotidyltransferase domain-containing protein [Peptococcaceae bacterium]